MQSSWWKTSIDEWRKARRLEAALHGAREIAAPVLTMAATLVAVYAPLGLVGGLTGALFSEFAFTLAAAVVVSAIVALTVSPWRRPGCFKGATSRFGKAVESATGKIVDRYDRLLGKMLRDTRPVLMVGAGVLVGLPILFGGLQSELAPTEDQGEVIVDMKAPEAANLEFLEGKPNVWRQL